MTMKVKEIYERYSMDTSRCSAASANAFCNLKDLLIFFDQYHSKNFTAALKVNVLLFYYLRFFFHYEAYFIV